MKKLLAFVQIFFAANILAQNNETPFEKSNKKQTASYFECISFYKQLDNRYATISIKAFDTTDAGYPLHIVLFSADKNFNPVSWRTQGKVVIMINNGIHPGEPDGIDASMMFLRDIASGKLKAPNNAIVAIIPVYNIGGCLNRNRFSRVNQNGPDSYGFRGNAQNLDLNRDFIKTDSRDALAFEKIFNWLMPDIFIDNHVSDGADYQHTMTLITTQHNKLGGETGAFLRDVFDPAIYKSMAQKKWAICPYVNFEEADPSKGWEAFYDPPRYSSGYAALFQTIAYIPETHMLKPFANRVYSTYSLMQTIVEEASFYAKEIIEKRKKSIEAIKQQQHFVLSWQPDTSTFEYINFKGYMPDFKTSGVTGKPRLFYDHTKPFEKQVKFFNNYKPQVWVQKPKAYIIPHGWKDIIERLKINGVKINRLIKDTLVEVDYYHIDEYESYKTPYEKHHCNYNIKLSTAKELIQFLAGDYIVYTGQANDRYIVETLEPLGEDSFFKWNFFDAILQQKEGYSNYRWEDVAELYLQQHPDISLLLKEKKKTDSTFSASEDDQLDFVYKHSPYYEPAHLRYPVYRVMKF